MTLYQDYYSLKNKNWITYNTFTCVLSESNNWEYTFGETEEEKEKLRAFAPTGYPFRYSVTETIINYMNEESGELTNGDVTKELNHPKLSDRKRY